MPTDASRPERHPQDTEQDAGRDRTRRRQQEAPTPGPKTLRADHGSEPPDLGREAGQGIPLRLRGLPEGSRGGILRGKVVWSQVVSAEGRHPLSSGAGRSFAVHRRMQTRSPRGSTGPTRRIQGVRHAGTGMALVRNPALGRLLSRSPGTRRDSRQGYAVRRATTAVRSSSGTGPKRWTSSRSVAINSAAGRPARWRRASASRSSPYSSPASLRVSVRPSV